jgi:uncharacterized protein (DUF433 family)
MSIAVIKEHIEITPGICGGKPRIAGHRIRVQDIVVWHEQMGMSPDEILYHYPSITLSDIYAALLKAQTPSLLQQKLKNRQHG